MDDFFFRHGDLDSKKVGKRDSVRPFWVCSTCLEVARRSNSQVLSETLNKMSLLVKIIQSETIIKNTEEESKLIQIISALLQTQDQFITDECDELFRSKKDHEAVKKLSSERVFLSSDDRNKVLLHTLMALSKIDDLNRASDSKIKSLCVSYESLLNTRDKKVVTMPALGRNFRILKQTHSKTLFNSIAYPAGGKYWTVQKLAISELPELFPPSGDFVSTDDNLQVLLVLFFSELYKDLLKETFNDFHNGD